MLEIEKQNRNFLKIIDSLRFKVGSYNLYSNIVYLLFLKYVISYSDKFEFLDLEGYKNISIFKRKYDLARIGAEPLTIEDINNALIELDKDPRWGRLSFSDASRNYGQLFSDIETQRYVLNILDEIDFQHNPDYLQAFLELLISRCLGDVRKTGISITNKSLRDIASKILNVKSNDVYLDCFSGFSSTLLSINNYGQYIGYEIISDIALVSKMILIMCGKENFDIRAEDFLESDTHEIADKVFSDAPIMPTSSNYNLCREFGIKTKDVNLISLYKTLDSVKNGGMAVIAVPGKVLFSDSGNYNQMRKLFIESGLKAVVSLPPLWSGISINTNLLVIDKGYKGDIVFIEAKNLGFSDRKIYSLTDDTICKIHEAIINPKNIVGFSKLIDYRDVICHGTWLPSHYVDSISENNYRSIEKIDDELSKLYVELKNNL